MMNSMVEFCISNLVNGAQATYETLEKDPNIDLMEHGCLSYCSKCERSLYALVNGDIVQADTPKS